MHCAEKRGERERGGMGEGGEQRYSLQPEGKERTIGGRSRWVDWDTVTGHPVIKSGVAGEQDVTFRVQRRK